MASESRTPAPAPAKTNDKSSTDAEWSPPTSDQEFKFESIKSAPAWVDKNWASFDRGPALAVPMGNLDGTGPYHTASARVGDIVKYTAPVGATPGKFTIVKSEPEPGKGTKLPPQQTSAQLEDLLRLGWITPEDMGADAKAQVIARSPGMARYFSEEDGGTAKGKGAAPKTQDVGDIIKI
jgi:hypothetical protein